MQDQLAKLNDQGISACMNHTRPYFCATLYCGDSSDIKLPLLPLDDLRTQRISCSTCTQKCVSMTRKYKLFSTVYCKPGIDFLEGGLHPPSHGQGGCYFSIQLQFKHSSQARLCSSEAS